MKRILFICIVTFSIAGCSSPNAKKGTTDTVVAGDTIAKAANTPKTNDTPTITSTCYVRTDGRNDLDSTSVELIVKGSTVTGEMNWVPYQKDARKGILNGSQLGDTIRAVWIYKQEGITDSMIVKFKVKDNQLSQKPFKADPKTGVEKTDESAGYSIKYRPLVALKK